MGQSLQGGWRWAGREVRFGPKTDLIPMPNPVAHASRLCNRAEEYGHAGSSECPRAQAGALEQGKADRGKPPLRTNHVWSIRTKLQIEGHARDLAMFNLAIDSKLRGCDVVAIRVEDVAAGGYTADRATVRQKKTGRPVRFELSEQTRQAVDDYLKVTGKRPGEFLFTGQGGPRSKARSGISASRSMTPWQ
jgi:integrase